MPNLSYFKTVEEYRNYYREYRRKNKEKLLLYNKEYITNWRNINGREHDYARDRLNSAVRNGKLKRLPCEKCGESKSHGHHEDYSKPLDVIWLCAIHHKERHTELRSLGIKL